MKDKTKFTMVGYTSMYFCGLLYIVPSLLMYLAYNKTGLKDLYYQTFSEYGTIKVFNVLMNINFLFGLSSMNIYNMEMLEKVRCTSFLIRDSQGNLSSSKVITSRIVFTSIVLFFALFLTDLRIIYAINGVFLNSFIGLIIPGLLGLLRSSEYRSKDTITERFGDSACLVCGVLSLVFFFVDLWLNK